MEPIVPNKNADDISQIRGGNVSSPQLIRTMRNDVSEAMRTQNETVVSIALKEESRRSKERKETLAAQKEQSSNASVPKRRGRMFVFFIILLVGALLAAGYVFVLPIITTIPLPKVSIPTLSFGKAPEQITAEKTPRIEPPLYSIISAQADRHFNISTESAYQIATEIAAEKNKGSAIGAIKNMYFAEGNEVSPVEISASRLFAFEGIRIPELLLGSLEKPFMVGLLGESSDMIAPFFVLRVSNHDTSLAGMIDWETELPNIFSTIFGFKIETDTSMRFYDTQVAGRDARLLDGSAKTAIAYAFADKNTIIITTSRTALETLISLATKN